MGDFNLPGIDWNVGNSKSPIDSVDTTFLEVTRDCFLHQHILFPTRGRGANKPSLLDLVLTDDENLISDVYEAPLGKKDHCMLEINVNCNVSIRQSRKQMPLFNKGDYSQIREDLVNIDWTDEFHVLAGDDIDGQWQAIKNNCLTVCAIRQRKAKN